MEVLVSLLASGACDKYPDFNFVLGESGVTWLPYVFDRLDTEYHDRARSLGFKMKPSDYFRRQGYVTYQQDKFLEPIVPLIGEDNIMWGSDYPHPDLLWPASHSVLAENLAAFSPSVRRKIVCDNAARLVRPELATARLKRARKTRHGRACSGHLVQHDAARDGRVTPGHHGWETVSSYPGFIGGSKSAGSSPNS